MRIISEDIRNYAKILNSRTFLALARGEHPRNIFSKIDLSTVPQSVRTVNDLFGLAYNSTQKYYRNEYIYKSAIVNKIIFGRHSPRTSALSVELPVGNSVVDLAVYNGTSTAYEIKTELDSPRRLSSQTPDYLKAFEYIYIVTHPRLAEKYAKTCHSQIGIMSLSSKDNLKIVKPAVSNLENIDRTVMFRMLRKDEFVTALENIAGQPINLANGLIRNYCHQLFCELDLTTAHKIYLSSLRKRTTTQESVQFLKLLPAYLRILGYATSLSKIQRQRLLASLETSIN